MANNLTMNAKVEHERLFGTGVDLFKNYYACLGIKNILSKIGVRTSSDNDWFRATSEFVKADELAALYDAIVSRDTRRSLAAGNHRRPPELNEDDPDDIIGYLSKTPVFRKKMWKGLHVIYTKRINEYKELLANPNRNKSAVEQRFEEMQKLFELSEQEVHLLMAVFLSQTRFIEYGDFDVNRYNSGEKVSAMARILGILDVEAAALLKDDKNIRKFGLVDGDMDIERTFLSYLIGINSTPLAARFWQKYEGEVLPWNFHGKLAEKHGEVLKKMIDAKPSDSGISAILYGIPGSGKSSFACSLAKTMGKDLYFIAQNDEDNKKVSYSPAFRFAALAVAQKQIDPEKSILVIDECDKLVENQGVGSGILARLFGGDLAGGRDSELKGMLNSVLDQNNRHPILWICNSKQEAIDPSSRRRFDYSIFFDELSATSRCFIWKNALSYYGCEGKLDDYFIEKISSRYKVNPGGISIAVKNAAMVCNHNPDLNFQTEVMTYLKAHCNLLGIQESPEELNEPARDYTLEGLNIRSGIKLPRLVEACKKFLEDADDTSRDHKRLNLLVFGPSGAGKTEFAKYLAQQLGRKICIKNASDLLNQYVGGTEQRISAAFAEAEANKEILLLDEGDSLLSSREGAVRSWEVSQVNTLLSEMEKFSSILIVSSNLIQRIDQAALRRFTFRLNFDYLQNDGKEVFFNTYFTKPMQLKELTKQEKDRLHAIEKITPSDFRNVRQQFYYLADNELTNMEIIEALEAELASKNSGSSYKGLGEVVSKIGF